MLSDLGQPQACEWPGRVAHRERLRGPCPGSFRGWPGREAERGEGGRQSSSPARSWGREALASRKARQGAPGLHVPDPSAPSTSQCPRERENQAHKVPGALSFSQQ